jgi:hypothetical protein
MIQTAFLFFALLFKTSNPVATIPNWLNSLPHNNGWGFFDVGVTSIINVSGKFCINAGTDMKEELGKINQKRTKEAEKGVLELTEEAVVKKRVHKRRRNKTKTRNGKGIDSGMF